MHPCGKIQKRFNEAGIEFDKVIGGRGNPIPFLRKKDARAAVIEGTGQDGLPALKLADGTVLTHSKDILAWADQQR
jgi:hypothetical protein